MYLLDSHILLWATAQSHKISRRVEKILQSDANIKVSIVSVWELRTKYDLGKLPVSDEFFQEIPNLGYQILPLTLDHIHAYGHLPFYNDHRDPFDRMLISQAAQDNLTFITADPRFEKYDAKVLMN